MTLGPQPNAGPMGVFFGDRFLDRDLETRIPLSRCEANAFYLREQFEY